MAAIPTIPDPNVRSEQKGTPGAPGFEPFRFLNIREAVAAVPALAGALADSDRDVRRSAALAMGKVGRQAQDALPALSKALHDPDGDVRWAAVLALSQIGAGSSQLRPMLIDSLRDPEARVRRIAAAALATGLSDEEKDSLPYVLPLLEDQDASVRQIAVQALGRMRITQSEAVPLLPLLHRALQDASPAVRAEAVTTLRSLGHELPPTPTGASSPR